MHPEPEDEYFLGTGPDDDDYGSNDDHGADDERTRRGALVGLGVVVVLVAVAITLTSLFVDTSAVGRGPSATARQWGVALVHGDTAARRRLECAGGSQTAGGQLALAGATGVSAGNAHRLGPDRWTVPLDIDGPGGAVQDSVDVTVLRRSGHFRVC